MERVEGTDIDARLKKGKNTEEELMPGYLRRSCEKFAIRAIGIHGLETLVSRIWNGACLIATETAENRQGDCSSRWKVHSSNELVRVQSSASFDLTEGSVDEGNARDLDAAFVAKTATRINLSPGIINGASTDVSRF